MPSRNLAEQLNGPLSDSRSSLMDGRFSVLPMPASEKGMTLPISWFVDDACRKLHWEVNTKVRGQGWSRTKVA